MNTKHSNDLIQKKHFTFTPENIDSLSPNEVFVFGSNLAGYHGGGAARVALIKFGATWGKGIGLQGQSYAIPTMQGGVETIRPYVDEFIAFAKTNTQKHFYVTRIGCGIAGFSNEQIAPLFIEALGLNNVCLPESFFRILVKPQVTESYKIMEYGQIRTLLDIVKSLNDEHHYSSINSLSKDFNPIIEQYTRRGTVPISTYNDFLHLLIIHESSLFGTGQLDIPMLNELIAKDRGCTNDKLEAIYDKRAKSKMFKLLISLNEFRQYSTFSQLIDDLSLIRETSSLCSGNRFDDNFYYPLILFRQGLNAFRNEVVQNGYLSNELLEKFMFLHDEKVKKTGIPTVIEMDYAPKSFCHNIYLPRPKSGTGPAYIKREGDYMRACNGGMRPTAYPGWYEYELIKPILKIDPEYEQICNYYLPVNDYSKPVYDRRIGKKQFKDNDEKRSFIDTVRNIKKDI